MHIITSGRILFLFAQWKYEVFLVWIHHRRQRIGTLLFFLGNNSIHPSADAQDFSVIGAA